MAVNASYVYFSVKFSTSCLPTYVSVVKQFLLNIQGLKFDNQPCVNYPLLQYKGVHVPALERKTLPKSPIETSDSSPDTESKDTGAKFTFENTTGDCSEISSENYDDTLKVSIKSNFPTDN